MVAQFECSLPAHMCASETMHSQTLDLTNGFITWRNFAQSWHSASRHTQTTSVSDPGWLPHAVVDLRTVCLVVKQRFLTGLCNCSSAWQETWSYDKFP